MSKAPGILDAIDSLGRVLLGRTSPADEFKRYGLSPRDLLGGADAGEEKQIVESEGIAISEGQ